MLENNTLLFGFQGRVYKHSQIETKEGQKRLNTQNYFVLGRREENSYQDLEHHFMVGDWEIINTPEIFRLVSVLCDSTRRFFWQR